MYCVRVTAGSVFRAKDFFYFGILYVGPSISQQPHDDRIELTGAHTMGQFCSSADGDQDALFFFYFLFNAKDFRARDGNDAICLSV